MAAFVQVEVNLVTLTENQAAQMLINDSTKPEEGLQAIIQLLTDIQAGTCAAQVALATNTSSAGLSGNLINLTVYSTINQAHSAYDHK